MSSHPIKRHESPHFVILLDEKQDGILVDTLTDALEKTHQVMAEQYGFKPKEKVRVELFPDARAFYLASTLSVRDIEVTGAVGLTKFNKLQFLSPRALVHGYRWLDAISHEYMHYLIVKLTSNKAPIWFHEGLSKYEETRWRNGPSYLSPVNQTLLAQALANEKLIPFEKMEPSLISLETPEDVQLAYAQAASAIEFILTTAGHDRLQEIMKRMADSNTRGAGEAIKEVLGFEFSEFEKKWREFLASKELSPVPGVAVHRYKVSEGRTDEERLDMEEIKSMVARNRAHLGDRSEREGPGQRSRARVSPCPVRGWRLCSHPQPAFFCTDRHRPESRSSYRSETSQELSPDHPTPYTQTGSGLSQVEGLQTGQRGIRRIPPDQSL